MSFNISVWISGVRPWRMWAQALPQVTCDLGTGAPPGCGAVCPGPLVLSFFLWHKVPKCCFPWGSPPASRKTALSICSVCLSGQLLRAGRAFGREFAHLRRSKVSGVVCRLTRCDCPRIFSSRMHIRPSLSPSKPPCSMFSWAHLACELLMKHRAGFPHCSVWSLGKALGPQRGWGYEVHSWSAC